MPPPVPVIDDAQLERCLPMPAAIDAVEALFATEPLPSAPPRRRLDVGEGDLLVMPSWGASGVGVKLVTVAAGNPGRGLPLIHGIYVLFSAGSLTPMALFDGAGLTRLRTAAVSGVATRHLAREDASRLVVFGAGVQAAAHIDAMRAVRPIEDVTIVSRTPDRAEELARRVQGSTGTPASVERADIVCTCTTSSVPVFDGAALAPGVHVNAIGAYEPDARELDDVTVARSRVIVETKAAALEEAGDVILPVASGAISEPDIEELTDVVRGGGRHSPDETTIFKSVGVAFEDLAIAVAAYERAGR